MIIDTWSFSPIYYVFGLVMASLFIYVIATTELQAKDKKTRIAKYLWLVAGVFLLLNSSPYIGHYLYWWVMPWWLSAVTGLLWLVMASIIALLFPEALLLSRTQIARACKLYVEVKVHEEERSQYRYGMQLIYDYIKKIPKDVFEECVGARDA